MAAASNVAHELARRHLESRKQALYRPSSPPSPSAHSPTPGLGSFPPKQGEFVVTTTYSGVDGTAATSDLAYTLPDTSSRDRALITWDDRLLSTKPRSLVRQTSSIEDSLYWRQRRSELVASALDYETKQLRRSREGSRSPQRRMHLTTAADVRNGTRPRSAPVGDRKTNFQATQWNAPWKAALHEYPFEDPSGPKLRNWRTEGRFRRDPADGDALEATFLSTQSYGGRKICKGCNQMSPKKSHWSPCSSELSKLDDGHWRTYDPVQPKSDNLDWRRYKPPGETSSSSDYESDSSIGSLSSLSLLRSGTSSEYLSVSASTADRKRYREPEHAPYQTSREGDFRASQRNNGKHLHNQSQSEKNNFDGVHWDDRDGQTRAIQPQQLKGARILGHDGPSNAKHRELLRESNRRGRTMGSINQQEDEVLDPTEVASIEALVTDIKKLKSNLYFNRRDDALKASKFGGVYGWKTVNTNRRN